MIYDKIKQLAQKRGITIQQMERDLSLARGNTCKWNTVEPGIRKVQKVADYLGVSIEELLADDEKGR